MSRSPGAETFLKLKETCAELKRLLFVKQNIGSFKKGVRELSRAYFILRRGKACLATKKVCFRFIVVPAALPAAAAGAP